MVVDKGILFSLKDITHSPETPKLKEPFTVKGKVELFGMSFFPPIWVQAKVTYPEKWWEEIIPIIGSPTESRGTMAVGGDFEVAFPKGFDREGEFVLEVEAYAGPTYSMDSMVLPPFPPMTSEETTFMVAGEVPPEEVGFKNFVIKRYGTAGHVIGAGGVVELEAGDILKVIVGFDHMDGAVTGEMHAAIWQRTPIDPHDEVLSAEKAFSVPSAPDWEYFEESIDIPITSKIAPGDEYGLYVKIMGITGGDIFTPYLEDVVKIIGPPGLGFDLTKPTVSKTPVDPGTAIDIYCPVKSRCTEDVWAKARVIIYEGSILPGHGTKIADYESEAFYIVPGETNNLAIHHTTVQGTINRRDIEVEVYVNGKLIKQSEWDDVYYVTQPAEEVVDFDLVKPTASPAEVTPGGSVTITCPVISRCTKPVTATIKAIIYEGSALPGHGTKIREYVDVGDIIPGERKDIRFGHTAILGTIDRRDIGVEVYVVGKLIKGSEWDDVYYVREAVVEMELLEVKIDPYGGGYVTVSPTPESGVQHYWYFPHGTTVYVTAHPNPGYSFKSWSGEMTDTTSVTAPVYPMTEKRTITAHFEKEAIEEYSLTVGVAPYGAGGVSKSPDKSSYSRGEHVTLTAYPYTGYEFDYWSGDATGYSTSIYVVMDSNKSITANFKAAIPPPPTKVSFSVKGDGFPFLTSYWKLYHYDREGNIWQDYTLHLPGDIISIRNVQSAGRLSCHCVSSVTGEWSEQFFSTEFAAVEGGSYTYDIASGIVYYR